MQRIRILNNIQAPDFISNYLFTMKSKSNNETNYFFRKKINLKIASFLSSAIIETTKTFQPTQNKRLENILNFVLTSSSLAFLRERLRKKKSEN